MLHCLAMDPAQLPDDLATEALENLVAGYQKTQALYVMVKLGIADQLGKSTQPVGVLAAAIGADPGACYRLLRALEFMGIVREPSPRVFALTSLGQHLNSEATAAMRDEILMTGDLFCRWWTGLEHSVRTGESSVPGIEGVSSFEHLHRDPEHTRRFNRLMSAMVGAMAKGVLAVYDFSRFGKVVDIGGGRGTLLLAILETNPNLRGVLFDVPATAEEAKQAIAARGLADRCVCVGGDFFAAVPEGDCLVLSAVLSDWNDGQCVAILENCRRAVTPDGRILVLERLLEPERPAPASAFMDLQMLVIGGGTGRSADEFRRLFGDAGFELGARRSHGNGAKHLRGASGLERVGARVGSGTEDGQNSQLQRHEVWPSSGSGRCPQASRSCAGGVGSSDRARAGSWPR